MNAVIDFAVLAKELREAPETLVDQKDREDISPYMLEVILPMLARGEFPLLKDIDFDQFDRNDPCRLAEYAQNHSNRAYTLEKLNQELCELVPLCVSTRAFL